MRFILLIGLALTVSGSEFVEVQDALNFLERIGIPSATRIKAQEDAFFAKTNDSRVVGGANSMQSSHPYLAGLIIEIVNVNGQAACGSSLLTANRLVTAAHCWFDGTNQGGRITVVLGSQYLFYGGTRIPTTNVITHPQWNPSTLANDVAMIYLPTYVSYSTNIQPIALPSPAQLSETFVGEWALASGFGKTSDQQVGVSTTTSEVVLRVITVMQCRETFGATFIQPSTLCTSGNGGVGVCSGDSGGPLVINRNGQNILVGISSFVVSIGCQLGYPSAFARVTSFYGFIVEHLRV